MVNSIVSPSVHTVDESIIMQGPFCSARKVDAETGATISIVKQRRVFFGDVDASAEPLTLVEPDATPLQDAAAAALVEINSRASARKSEHEQPGLLARLMRR